ncbi:MAG TPA: class I SAM-dependent methyltransferase [Solirubrobacteraceae bacterium]|nr:class I SAM-dependent methyltransferase [Solirubrobacteraceae bacterium]
MDARARGVLAQEPKVLALYESVLEQLPIGEGTRLLDVGCGAGLFLRLAAQCGANVVGIDADATFVEVARERVPDAEVVVGDMETLPHDDECFDVVTGFDTFQLASDPGRALREAARVARPGAAVVIATWGRPEQCEAARYVNAVRRRLVPSTAGPWGPFALSSERALTSFASAAGLIPGARHDVPCVWNYADDEHLLAALRSTWFAVEAIAAAGEECVTAAILESVAPYRMSGGDYRLENLFSYLIATTRHPPQPAANRDTSVSP